MNDAQVSNLFWRFKAKYMSQERFVQAMQQEVSQLVVFTAEYDPYRDSFRHFARQQMLDFEDLLNIDQMLSTQQFDQAVQQLKKAYKLYLWLKGLLQVIALFEYVQDRLDQIYHILDHQLLASLPSIEIIRSLIENVETSLKGGDYQKAKVLLHFIIGKVRDMDNPLAHLDIQKKALLTQKLNKLKRQIEAMQPWHRYLPDETVTVREDVVQVLFHLLEEGQFRMVELLIEDVELYLEPANSFLQTWERISPSWEEGSHHDLQFRALTDELQASAWAGGTRYLLISQLQRQNAEN